MPELQGLCHDQLCRDVKLHSQHIRHGTLEGLLLTLFASQQALAGSQQHHCSECSSASYRLHYACEEARVVHLFPARGLNWHDWCCNSSYSVI